MFDFELSETGGSDITKGKISDVKFWFPEIINDPRSSFKTYSSFSQDFHDFSNLVRANPDPDVLVFHCGGKKGMLWITHEAQSSPLPSASLGQIARDLCPRLRNL
jgi:hypothetical protein